MSCYNRQMVWSRRKLLGIGVTLLVAGLAVTAYRVSLIETAQLDRSSQWRRLDGSTGDAVELLRVPLRAGTLATVEICALDPMAPDGWTGALEFAARRADGDDLVSLPLTEGVLSYASRSTQAACLLLAYDEPITAAGEYIVEARPLTTRLPEVVARAPLRAQIMARAPLIWLDHLLVFLLLVGALLAVVGTMTLHEPEKIIPPSFPLLRAVAGVLALLGVTWIVSLLPFAGPLGGLLQGTSAGIAQITLALILVGGGGQRGRHLALVPPNRAWWPLLLAPIVGIGAWFIGEALGQLVPSTGEAPIQTFLSSPAGFLTVAALAASAPLAEELFFRGFLYGVLAARLGQAWAFVITLILFVGAHVDQLWGAWGSLAALFVTALVLTGLRWWTGSVVAPILAHLAHNGVLLALSLRAVTGD